MFAYILKYNDRALKKLDTVTRKSLCVALALVLSLGLVGMPNALAQTGCVGECCGQCDMRGSLHTAEAKRISPPWSCCCGAKATPCDVSQGCASEMPDFALFAVPRVENPAPADIASVRTNGCPFLNFLGGLTNKVWNLGMGPPGPLYLFNLSLLC
ncbi:MAG TPA: hypothetical protein ENN18_11945 [Proteobacteria bacterium]|nr:hypothetical protein [Pseudomonadota bacterium]